MPSSSPALPSGPAAPPIVQSLLLARHPVGALERARARYGPVFGLRLALVGPVVVVSTPDAVERIVRGDYDRTHAGEARRGVLPQASAASMFGADGDRHRTVRRRAEPSFALSAIDARRAEMTAVVERHVEVWPIGRPFRLLSRLRTLCEELFVRFVLGVEDDERARRLVAAVGAALRTPGNPPLVPPDRDEAWPLGPLLHLEVQRRLRPIRRLLAEELTVRRIGNAAATASAVAPGAGILDHVARTGMDADAALDELLVVLAAAQEPPSIALTRVLDRFAREPQLVARLEREGPDDELVEAAIAETLRLHPPALASLRRLTEPVEIGGHRLPAGIDVMVPLPLLHRDPAVFPDPHRFDAIRMLGERPTSYLPFGDGVRRCPGEELAGVELSIVLPAVLRRLQLRPVSRHPERSVQRATVLVPIRGGLVVAERRTSPRSRGAAAPVPAASPGG